MDQCPCGSAQTYSDCCEPIITGSQTAQTAEALMRARYSAYVQGQVQFIYQSTYPDKRSGYSEQEIEAWSRNSEWQGLTIIATHQGGPEDETGTVEFIAAYTEKDRPVRHHEIASFRRHEGGWYFYDGQPPPARPVVRDRPKVGRNEPCPCGSGLKFKKCCGRG
ncbi:YchJ family protein [Desulfofustis glycolicus]|uniref:SEC-C motif-containing protein n=1 Tax=Desulfofustis glycolicus DSM 9705 TaxID=1121409 RepID=A0A1M5WEX6_9BACT|nr:YchJ family protein [Desulfofustis glycolicus]MCB2217031.1 YchJ family protein [Desulfobulbaceae bacterium]SHH86065.1 SEC-C motif-containing protein [Desulfofustis glycolicus DSM 9705]